MKSIIKDRPILMRIDSRKRYLQKNLQPLETNPTSTYENQNLIDSTQQLRKNLKKN